MGGTIARLASQGHRVLLLDLTDGEPTPHGDRATRAKEAAEAARILAAERQRNAESLAQLQNAREGLTSQFEALSRELLEQRAQTFAQQNQTSLQALLEPLRQQIGEFKAKVEEVYVAEGKDRSALKQQVEELARLNQTLRADTVNLTEALRG